MLTFLFSERKLIPHFFIINELLYPIGLANYGTFLKILLNVTQRKIRDLKLIIFQKRGMSVGLLSLQKEENSAYHLPKKVKA